MNTKKAVWIGRPEKMRMTLHSIAFRSEDAHSVLFVLGEDGEMSISYSSEAKAALTLLHTPQEYIVFGEERIVISFKGVRTEIPHAPIRSLKLVKEGQRLSFYSGDEAILSIEKEAFSSSISFGLSSKGEGEVELEVF